MGKKDKILKKWEASQFGRDFKAVSSSIQAIKTKHQEIQKQVKRWKEGKVKSEEVSEEFVKSDASKAVFDRLKKIPNADKYCKDIYLKLQQDASGYDEALDHFNAATLQQKTSRAEIATQKKLFDKVTKEFHEKYMDIYAKLSLAKNALEALDAVVPDKIYEGQDYAARIKMLNETKSEKTKEKSDKEQNNTKAFEDLKTKLYADQDTEGSIAYMLKDPKFKADEFKAVHAIPTDYEDAVLLYLEAYDLVTKDKKARESHHKEWEEKISHFKEELEAIAKLNEDIASIDETIGGLEVQRQKEQSEEKEERIEFNPDLMDSANEALKDIRSDRVHVKKHLIGKSDEKPLDILFSENCKNVVHLITKGDLKGHALTEVVKKHIGKLLDSLKGFDELPKLESEYLGWVKSLANCEKSAEDTEGFDPVISNLIMLETSAESMQLMGQNLWTAQSIVNNGTQDIEFLG